MTPDDAQQLLDEASHYSYGPESVALLERAVAAADAVNDDLMSIRCRGELIRASTMGGAFDRALVAYSWCLAKYDEDPANYPSAYELWWQYKWIAAGLPTIAAVSRQQIEAVLDDVEARYERAGVGPVPALKLRWRAHWLLGDLDRAVEYYDRWRLEPRQQGLREYMSDCAACDIAESAALFVALGRYEEALSLAAPVLQGHASCAEVPNRSFGELLEPMIRLGRWDDAFAAHLRGYPMVNTNPDFLDVLGYHFLYTAAVKPDHAVALVERHLPAYQRSTEDMNRWMFATGAVIALDCAGTAQQLRVVPEVAAASGHPAAKEVPASDVRSWLAAEQAALTEAFDRRNGNTHYGDVARGYRALVSWAAQQPQARTAVDRSRGGSGWWRGRRR